MEQHRDSQDKQSCVYTFMPMGNLEYPGNVTHVTVDVYWEDMQMFTEDSTGQDLPTERKRF